MANKKIIQTSHAPTAIGPYSQAISCGNMLFLSGQIGIHPQTGNMVDEDICIQTRQVFENVRSICEAAGGTLQHVVKIVIYLTDLKYFSQVNELMAQYFKEPYPARSTVEVSALPRQALIEIDAIVYL